MYDMPDGAASRCGDAADHIYAELAMSNSGAGAPNATANIFQLLPVVRTAATGLLNSPD